MRRDQDAQRSRIMERSTKLANMLGDVTITEEDILVSDAVLAPGYGQMNPQVNQAISLAAKSDAILLDPVYSGRTFAGLINLKKNGSIAEFTSAAASFSPSGKR